MREHDGVDPPRHQPVELAVLLVARVPPLEDPESTSTRATRVSSR